MRKKNLQTGYRATRTACLISGTFCTLIFLLPAVLGLPYFLRDFAATAIPRICDLRYLLLHRMSLGLSPFIGLGEPVFSNPEAQILYPFTWIAALFPPDIGASVSTALQLGLSAAVASWLLRTFKLGLRVSATGGILFVFTGTVLNLICHAFYLSAALGLPLCWAAGRRLLQGHMTRENLSLLFLGFYLLISGGDIQALMESGWILLAECATRMAQRRSVKKNSGSAAWIAATLLAALLCTSTFLLSAREELMLARHLHGLSMESVVSWAYGPLQWLATFWKGILSQPFDEGYTVKKALYPLSLDPPFMMAGWNDTPYLGFLWIIAAGFGLRFRRTRVAAWVAVAALILSLGGHTPVLPFLAKWIPGFKLFRYPMKYLLPFNLATLVLVASGCSALARREAWRKPLIKVLVLFLTMTALTAGGILAFGSPLDGLTARAKTLWVLPNAIRAFPSFSQVLLRIAIAGTIPLAIALFIIWAFRGRKLWFECLILMDLLLAASTAVSIGPSLLSKDLTSPLLELQKQTPIILCHQEKLTGLGFPSHNDEGEEWFDMAVQKMLAMPNLGACDQIRLGTPYSVMSSAEQMLLYQKMSEARSEVPRALGCTHWISMDAPDDGGSTRVSTPNLDKMKIPVYQLKDPLPEAFLLPEGVPVKIAAYEKISPTQARITLDGRGPATVGLKTSYRFGWRATQAGQPLTTFRAASVMLAAAVPNAENGPVEWRYEIPHLRLSFVLTALGIVLLTALVFLIPRFSRTDAHVSR